MLEPRPRLTNTGAALCSTDFALVKEIAERNTPVDQDVIDIGRLYMRYCTTIDTEEMTPQELELVASLKGVIKAWGMERDDVMQRCRKLWQSGWRPGQSTEEITVGSGADAE